MPRNHFAIIKIIVLPLNYFYGNVALTFLLINGLNLLPVYPLDGGHVVYNLIFCRNKYLEFVFKIVMGAFLLYYGRYLSYVLSIFGVAVMLSAISSFKITTIAEEIRQVISEEHLNTTNILRLPRELIERIILSVTSKFKSIKNQHKRIATYTISVWEKVIFNKPSIIFSVLMLILYLIILFVTVIALFFAIYTVTNYTNYKIVTKEDGNKIVKLSTYHFTRLMHECEITTNGIKDGEELFYFKGKVIAKGYWIYGKKNGKWSFYNSAGKNISNCYYESGKYIYSDKGEGTKNSYNFLLNFRARLIVNID